MTVVEAKAPIRVIFRNASLIDGGRVRRDATVVVEGTRITAVTVGDVSAAPAPAPGVEVHDLAGRTLMPGLVTAHFHATYEDVAAPETPLGTEKPPAYLALRAARHYEQAILAGFTGAVSAGGPLDLDAQLELAIADGLAIGPRIVAGSRALVTTGDPSYYHGDWWWQMGNHGGYLTCDGAEEFRKAVRGEIARGAEILKIFPSGGHGLVESKDLRGLSPEELRAVVQAAHERGKKVRAHAVWKPIILECIAAGVDVIDHGDELDGGCIDAMARAGTFLVPSMRFLRLFLDDLAAQSGGKARTLAPLSAEYANMQKWLPVANGAGVKILLGDDYGARLLPHGSYAGELGFYVKECGIAAADVLRWGTRHGAELVGAGGQVAPGVHADLLVVDGDPLADVTLLEDPRRVHAIMKGGAFVRAPQRSDSALVTAPQRR
jgi:imidazolonepropionase-like amidohydrolase